MRKVKVWEVSSGFANVSNNVILAEYYGTAAMNRPGSAYDNAYTIELPDGFTVEEDAVFGELCIWHGDKHVELASVNHEKGHVLGVSIEGFHHFKICQ